MSSTPPGAPRILYTLDGSDPAAGSRFSAPLPLSHTIIVRAVAVDASGSPLSEATTHTIILTSDVLTQPPNPPGWPLQWGGAGTGMSATPADYAVDPRGGLSAADLLSVPVVSLVMPSIDGWFGTQGLYNNREDTSPFPTSFEFMPPPSAPTVSDPPQMPQLSVGCGVSSQGGSSVTSSSRGWKDEKASLRLRFKSEFGAKELDAGPGGIFTDSDAAVAFDGLILDAQMNNEWHYGGGMRGVNQRMRGTGCIRDQLVSDMMQRNGLRAPHGRLVLLFLNGLLWGLYDLHERPDEKFCEWATLSHCAGHFLWIHFCIYRHLSLRDCV